MVILWQNWSLYRNYFIKGQLLFFSEIFCKLKMSYYPQNFRNFEKNNVVTD